jgi:pyruvate kinase
LEAVQELRGNVVATGSGLIGARASAIRRSGYRPSAANLAHYIGLRRYDIREFQTQLATLGLSSLGRSESHVLASLDAVENGLHLMAGDTPHPGGSMR